MSWSDFSSCMASCGQQVSDALSQVGEAGAHVISQIAGAWRALPLDVRGFIIVAARYNAAYLIAALAAAGVEGGEVLEVIAMAAIAVGVGVFMAALLGCSATL